MRVAARLAALALLGAACGAPEAVVVGSKDFLEQDVLAEILAQELEARGVEVERRFHLGGTDLAHAALTRGDVDLYVEYTGTALVAVLDQPPLSDPDAVYAAVEAAYLERWDLVLGPPLGFENTFALVVRRADAEALGLATISDLARVAGEWTAAFGPEFMSRADGAPGLARAYGFEFGEVRQMDLGLLYRALADGDVDVAVGNSTDGQIAALDLVVLRDDRRFFPPYQAVPIVRRGILEAHPPVWDAIQDLTGAISAEAMRELNRAALAESGDVATVVRRWRATRGEKAAADSAAAVADSAAPDSAAPGPETAE